MIVIGILLGIAGIGFFCWLPFTLAVYALPCFAGMTAGLAAFHSGSGVVGALVFGVLAGGATLAIGQIVFATVRTPLIRAVIGLLYAVPASIAGYPRDAWTLPYRRAVGRLARSFCSSRRCFCWRHGLGADDVCPAPCRTANRGRSGIVSTGGRDQGRVSPRFIVDRLAIGATLDRVTGTPRYLRRSGRPPPPGRQRRVPAAAPPSTRMVGS